MLGDKREQVAQFSFFMVIIPILGEALLGIKKMVTADPEAATQSIGLLPIAVGFIASFIVGCIACRWMLEIVKRGKLVWFSIYCAIAGLVCILY